MTRWDEVANRETGNNRFIIVYPEGTSGGMEDNEDDGIKCFNAGDGLDGTYDGCCWTAQKNKAEDVQFIKALVEKMKGTKEYNIDPQRIYGSGLSNGSSLIQKVLVEEPGVFTAVYVASQTLLQFPEGFPENDYHLSVPIMLSHGVYDKKVHYKGEESLYDIDGDGEKETAFHFPSAISNAKRWKDINNCGKSTFARMTNDGHLRAGAQKDWYDCDNGVRVRLRAVYGGHLHYSGTLIDEAWDFLKQWTKE
jgi:poly(3-hydroxybutyrate) depolymerase